MLFFRWSSYAVKQVNKRHDYISNTYCLQTTSSLLQNGRGFVKLTTHRGMHVNCH